MSDKYKNEIEEILRRADEVMPGDRSRPQRRPPKTAGGAFNPLGRLTSGRRLKVSAGKLMLTSFALLLLALILDIAGVGNVVILVAAGLVLFVISFALFFVRPTSSSPYEKRWRGRVIEGQPSLWDRFRSWLRG